MLSYILDYKKNKNRVLAFIILYCACLLELLLSAIYSSNCIPVTSLPIPTNIINVAYIIVIIGGSLFNALGTVLIGLLIAKVLTSTKLKNSQIGTKHLLHLIISVYPVKCLISVIISSTFIVYLCVTDNLAFGYAYPLYNNIHAVGSVLSILLVVILTHSAYRKACK